MNELWKINVNVEISEANIASAQSACGKLFSPLLELGEWGGQEIRNVSKRRQIEFLASVDEEAKANGIELQPVSTKFLLPLLEAVGQEDESPELTEMWKNLLISQSSNAEANMAHFVHMLRQITAEEANTLETIYDQAETNGFNLYLDTISQRDTGTYWGGPRKNARALTILTVDEIAEGDGRPDSILLSANVDNEIISLFNLERHNLIKIETSRESVESDTVEADENARKQFRSTISAEITPLGYIFVRACRGEAPVPMEDINR